MGIVTHGEGKSWVEKLKLEEETTRERLQGKLMRVWKVPLANRGLKSASRSKMENFTAAMEKWRDQGRSEWRAQGMACN
ncbi:hypothetical protein SLEP1_g56813 [Rubroshorea leprosula]|uniref:Uncharacterized protein n=1 Tax=Rubroshorea leprosula TaxID=152421 RepID=A0AAV5MNU3_9ROSI|nr:hypothetical protein SLEP1_g56813 [Rubroshorea leprosula]